MDERTAAAVDWLLASDEPAVRALTRRDLLGEDVEAVVTGPWVEALLTGGLDVHPYRKWVGAFWRLVSLVELGVSPQEPRVRAFADRVLTWLTGPSYRKISVVEGLPRRHASMEGNALAAGCRLGLHDDPRVRKLAETLLACQWPDGGWNCDPEARRRSSFHETLIPMWGLHEYGEHAAADRAAELLLQHRLFKSGESVINKRWLDVRYPPYWHYDILHALLVLSRMGRVGDPRAGDALDELERQRKPDGRWRARGYWWNPPGSAVAREVVDWNRAGPNEMITLNALRVLKLSGRLS